MVSAVRSSPLRMNSKSRRGSPEAAENASATVNLGVRVGSSTANSGSRSASGVSHPSLPASTSMAARSELKDLVTEPIRSNVSAVTVSGCPCSRTPKPCAKTISPFCTTAIDAPGTFSSSSVAAACTVNLVNRSPSSVRGLRRVRSGIDGSPSVISGDADAVSSGVAIWARVVGRTPPAIMAAVTTPAVPPRRAERREKRSNHP